ncbi:hypothetical protein PMIN04_003526 [Paraphaeosphaeria minitans]
MPPRKPHAVPVRNDNTHDHYALSESHGTRFDPLDSPSATQYSDADAHFNPYLNANNLYQYAPEDVPQDWVNVNEVAFSPLQTRSRMPQPQSRTSRPALDTINDHEQDARAMPQRYADEAMARELEEKLHVDDRQHECNLVDGYDARVDRAGYKEPTARGRSVDRHCPEGMYRYDDRHRPEREHHTEDRHRPEHEHHPKDRHRPERERRHKDRNHSGDRHHRKETHRTGREHLHGHEDKHRREDKKHRHEDKHRHDDRRRSAYEPENPSTNTPRRRSPSRHRHSSTITHTPATTTTSHTTSHTTTSTYTSSPPLTTAHISRCFGPFPPPLISHIIRTGTRSEFFEALNTLHPKEAPKSAPKWYRIHFSRNAERTARFRPAVESLLTHGSVRDVWKVFGEDNVRNLFREFGREVRDREEFWE